MNNVSVTDNPDNSDNAENLYSADNLFNTDNLDKYLPYGPFLLSFNKAFLCPV